eukprot:13075039-Alexandrium_andersonii.AAC.2
MAALARCSPARLLASIATSSTKASAGERLAEKAATTTGSNATRHKNGLMGPPTPMPVRAGRLARLPLGRANCACLARMNAVIRSTSHEGTRRRSRTALAQAGDNLSNALLWSISATARPPGTVGRPRQVGGPRALAVGPKRGGVELVVRLTLAVGGSEASVSTAFEVPDGHLVVLPA